MLFLQLTAIYATMYRFVDWFTIIFQNEKKQVDLANGNYSVQANRSVQRVAQTDNAAARKGLTLERDFWPALPSTVSAAQESGKISSTRISNSTKSTKPCLGCHKWSLNTAINVNR